MIRQGIVPMQCDIVKNMDYEEREGIIRELRAWKIEQELSVKNIELEELFPGGYHLRTKLGNRVATEIFEYYESLMRGEEKKLDNFETRATTIIKIWIGQSAMERNDCIVKWKAQDAMEINECERKDGERVVANFELLGSDQRQE